jgi:hypothetical protein
MPISDSIAEIIDLIRQAADKGALPRDVRLEIVARVRRAIIPKRKPGKKRDATLDKAYPDWEAGIRGLKLLNRHHPEFREYSRWRRKVEQDRFFSNLRKRHEREKNRARAAP